MKMAIYARTANEETSINLQIDVCKKYITFKKAELQDIYFDEGKSGNDPDREGLKRLIKAAENKKFDVIVTYGHDRLFRDLPTISNFLHKIMELGISHTVVHEQ